MGSAFFSTDVATGVLVVEHSLDSLCLTAIADAPEGVPHKIQLTGGDEKLEEIWGLRVRLGWPITMLHSACVYWGVSQALSGDGITRVGYLADGVFRDLGQFALTNVTREACFVAVGPRARAVLQALIDAELGYDPENFDDDGYVRRMPAQHPAVDPTGRVEAAG
jgi:hypothetical protein